MRIFKGPLTHFHLSICLTAITTLMLFGCAHENTTDALAEKVQSVGAFATEVEGEWFDSYFIGTENLFLKPDGRFEYYSHNCLGKKISAGKWKKNDGDFMLISDDKYRHENDTARYTSTIEWADDDSDSAGGFSLGRIVSIRMEFNPNSIGYTYFDSTVISSQGDSLVRFSRDGEHRHTYYRRRHF